MTPLLRGLLVAGALYGALVLLAWWFQGRLLYLPSAVVEATPADRGMPFEKVRLQAADAVELAGWYVPMDSPRGTLLFFHGNAGNISHRLDSIAQFRELGLAVFIVDYRGYGRSGGRPSERGTARDARAAWSYLTAERGVDPGRIVVFGRSLGAAVAAELACRVQPAAVVLESAFTSVPAVAASAYPFLPVRWLARIRYPTVDYVRRIRAPVLVIHSRDDEIIPFAHGRAVYDAAPGPKRFLRIHGGHNTGFLDSDAAYRAGVDDFLSEVAGLPRSGAGGRGR